MTLNASKPASFLKRTMVLIPALNEGGCVGSTIQFWRGLGVARVRVVDNGSVDATSAVAREQGAEVLLEPKRGYGAAAWRGLQDWPPTLDWVLFSSADGSDRLSPAEACDWDGAVDGGADLVVGDRTGTSGSLKWVQRSGNWFICRAIGLGWGRLFRDMGSLRLIRHETLMGLALADRGFGWNVEMQIRALQHGLNIVELPVRHYPREAGQSKISGTVRGTLRAGWGMVRMLGRLWEWRRAERRGLWRTRRVPSSRPIP